jgi:exonuclease SbcC
MVPTRLRLSQFLCYREPVDIDFRGIRLACLSGENGAGKSALLDAMTWALWGKARGRSDQDLISLGGRDMAVEFSFVLNGQEYRVVRRRSLAAPGRAGRLFLELHMRDGEQWRVLTGDNTRHTQGIIDRILGIDYETFINSAFILQNRADEFTTKQPAERKRVLGEILNLREYDEYEQLAREEQRRCQQELDAIERDLEAIARSLESLPALEAEVAEHRSRVEGLRLQLDELRRHWDQVLRSLEQLAASERSAEQCAEQIARRGLQVQERERQLVELRRRVLTYDEVLARAEEITARYQHWQQLRRALDEMSQRLRERQALLVAAHRLEESIQREVHGVEREMHACEQQIAVCERALAALPALEDQRERLYEEVVSFGDLDGQIEECQHQIQEQQRLRGELQAECRRLKEQMQELKRKIDQLDAIDAACPVCLRPLAEHERGRLKAEIEAAGRALGDEFRAKRAEIERLDGERARSETWLRSLQRSREQRDHRRQELARIDAQLASLAARRAELGQLQTRHRELADALERDLPGADFRAELERVRQQLTALPYDEGEAERLAQELHQLTGAEQEYQALQNASLAAGIERQQLATLEEQLASERAELEQLQHQLETLQREIARTAPLREVRDRLQEQLAAAEQALHQEQAALGRAEQRLEDAYAQRAWAAQLETERERLLAEKGIYEELVAAFGMNGIRVLIIENVVPELEERANAILDRMPGNALRLEFRTQRQKASDDGMIETLDILISDEAGRRPYELYSGGERFRIDFAIRVALSMLLAHRAGTRLELLVIDEGFGTQDAKGREGIVQAIRAVEDEFAMILVITHLDELKEQFPTRIEVVKAPQGSSVLVN